MAVKPTFGSLLGRMGEAEAERPECGTAAAEVLVHRCGRLDKLHSKYPPLVRLGRDRDY